MINEKWLEYNPNSKPISEVYIEAMKELLTPFPSLKLHGQKMFNETIGGFRLREFTILCGATGVGKTTLISNWSQLLLKDGIRHFVLSVETGPNDFVKRMMSSFLGSDINRGEALELNDLKVFDKKYGNYFKSDDVFLSLYNSRVNYKKVLEDIKYHIEARGCKIVFVDNLNFLMEVVAEKNQVIEMDKVIHDFIMFVKSHDVHIVMVMHPKKTTSGRVESEFDIKGSSTAVQEAQNVLLFNRMKDEDLQTKGYTPFHRELKFAKLRRRGEYTGKKIIYNSVGSKYEEVKLI